MEATGSAQTNSQVKNLENDVRPKSFRLAAISQHCWFVKVLIGDLDIKMLVDTGSAATLLSKQILSSLENIELEDESSILTTADGEPMTVIGRCTLDLSILNNKFSQSVIVADLGNLGGIIGLDFLARNRVMFDTGRGVLKFRDFDVVLTNDSEQETTCARVQLTETCEIPGESETFLKGRIKGKIPDLDSILEPCEGYVGEKHVIIPKSIVKSNDSEVIFSVLNPTPETVILKKNAYVASLEPVKEIHNQIVREPGTDSQSKVPNDLPDHLRTLMSDVSDRLSANEKNRLREVLGQYSDVFVGPDGRVGQTDLVRHKIRLRDETPIKIPARRLPIHQREIATEEIDKMLNQGIIEHSESPWAAPIVLVKKKDNTTRFCVDYRKLNSKTIKDSYPLPRIDDSLDSLSGAQYYCTLDLAQGFFQVKMSEEDKPKTAFATHRGLYQFRVMPFGLANSPKTFERLMELVLKGLQWERCLVYLDDVIVFGKTFTETLENLKQVFDRFRDAKLRLKPKKCTFFQDEVRYLGHIVSVDGIKCDMEKIKAVDDWPTPESVSDVRSFLGLASYYRKFIKNFSTLAFPLIQLTQKNRKFSWSDECDIAFQNLKQALISAPILSYPTRNGRFVLDTDASNSGIGAVLSQIQNGEERVIAYASKTLSRSQQNYCTTYRELLAVVTFVKHFRYYLNGKNFLIRTDHSSLIWLKNFKEPEGIVARWLSLLDTYDFQIEHRKGSSHGNADALSRRPRRRCLRSECNQCSPGNEQICSATGVNTVNLQSKLEGGMLVNSVESAQTPETTIINEQETNWLPHWSHQNIVDAQTNDKAISQVRDGLINGQDLSNLKSSNIEMTALIRERQLLTLENDILCRIWESGNGSTSLQMVVPKVLRTEILNQLHNAKSAGHLGREKTLGKLRARYYWPGMTSDVSRWCQTCILCQRRKPGPGLGKSPMQREPVYRPLECIAIDIMGPLPVTEKGNQYIMVVGDYFSKWTEAYPLPDHTAQTVADTLVCEFICRFGTPTRIHTDQGREFESHLFKRMCELFEIDKSRTTPFHPQSDGMVERYNRTLQQMLAMFVNQHKDDWDDHLPFLTMAYRSSVQESTKCTPNILMLGRETLLPIDLVTGSLVHHNEAPVECPVKYVEWLKDAMQNAFDFAHENLQNSFQKQKRYHDTKLKARSFEPKTLVLRWYPPEANQKLGLGWTGPYEVVRKFTDITYEIKRCTDGKLKIVHVDHLKPLNQRLTDDEERVVLNDENEVFDNYNDNESEKESDNRVDHTPKSPRFSKRGRRLKPTVIFSP